MPNDRAAPKPRRRIPRGDLRPGDPLRDASRGERLQRVLSDAGFGSRRACEEMIARGEVEVNGHLVRELPIWVDPKVDRIEVDGRPVRPPSELVYVVLYKPRRTMCTMSDPEGRKTVAELVDAPGGARLYPVGRLDYDTMGLLLLTNDGELANRLTHPRYGVEKTYRAVVKPALTEEGVQKLAKGVYLADRREGETTGASRTEGVRITIVKQEPQRTILDITLGEGRNRQVRRMLADVGCDVHKLVRIKMGPLSLRGLRVGQWRQLLPLEIRDLRRAAGGSDTQQREHPGEKIVRRTKPARKPAQARPNKPRSFDRPAKPGFGSERPRDQRSRGNGPDRRPGPRGGRGTGSARPSRPAARPGRPQRRSSGTRP